MNTPSIETIARQFGTSPNRVKAQYALNARYLRKMAAQAKALGKPLRGFTPEQWEAKATYAERRANATMPDGSTRIPLFLSVAQYAKALHYWGMSYHFDDDPRDLGGAFTEDEARHLDGVLFSLTREQYDELMSATLDLLNA